MLILLSIVVVPPEVGRFFSKSPQSFLFSTFFNKKHLKTLLYQHLFSYYKKCSCFYIVSRHEETRFHSFQIPKLGGIK